MAALPPDPARLPFRDRNEREPRREPWHPPLRRPRRRYPPLDDLDEDISFTFEFCYNQALSGVSTVLLFVAVYKWLLIEAPDDSLLPRTRRPRRRRENRSRSRSPIKAKLTNAEVRMELRLTIDDTQRNIGMTQSLLQKQAELLQQRVKRLQLELEDQQTKAEINHERINRLQSQMKVLQDEADVLPIRINHLRSAQDQLTDILSSL